MVILLRRFRLLPLEALEESGRRSQDGCEVPDPLGLRGQRDGEVQSPAAPVPLVNDRESCLGRLTRRPALRDH